ncbi:WD40 repeat protein [Williamsia limnetica]|uniref:WD40 repeat protein n=1 Tax=Williamsia limnetica TaxID=882452 RepID=A0A318RG33_WILLI|nr:WD40 repeat domain-containing protein [Williamsia limnetica]PYE12048.1 WD40 repeat protein [Williamsia limnetica]
MPIPQFSADLERLYEAAGSPPVASLVKRLRERLKLTGSTEKVPSGLAARIAEWKTATTPRKYTAIHQHLIQILLSDARELGNEGTVAVRESDYRRSWERTFHEGATVEGTVDRCPYRGLQSYTPEDVSLFFGRKGPVEELVTKARHAAVHGGVVMVVGASGAGKSSLLGAGLVPALGHPWLHLTPGTDPVKSLQIQLGSPLTALTAKQVLQTWAADHRTDAVTIVIDQAEELFTICTDKDGRDEFMEILSTLKTADRDGPQLVVAMGIRADFVGAFLDYPTGEAALRDHALMLGPMRRADLSEAITAPARQVGLRLESGLEELMVNELCGPGNDSYDAGALPMLSYALAETWGEREGTKLTLAGYHRIGGVPGALAATAERTWADLNEPQQEAARRLLLRLVNVGNGRVRDTRRIRERAELVDQDVKRDDEQSALDALADARLISIDASTVALTHEILLTGWPRLRQWIEDDRTGLLARQRLERDAAEWAGHADELYSGERLEAAEHSTAAHTDELSGQAKEFLELSRRHQRRKRWRQLALRAAAVAAVVAIVVAAFSYRVQANNADTARANAELGQILAAADRYQLSDPTLSAHLLLAAHKRDPDSESIYTRLLATQNAPLASELHGAKGELYSIAISPDGRTLSAASKSSSVHMWDISDPLQPRELPPLLGHQSFVTSVAYSPDGRLLATTSDDKTTRLWHLRSGDPKLLTILRGHEKTVFYSGFAPDGKTLATVSYDSTVRIWDISTPSRVQERGVLTGSEGPVRTLAWSPDGRTLATGGDDMKIRLWDVPNLQELGPPLTRQTNTIHALAWSKDGKNLLSGSDDTTAQMWDVTDRGAPKPVGLPFGGHTGALWSVTFSPDGTKASTASVDGTAKTWSLADPSRPTQVGETLDGASGQLFAAAWTPDGQYLATGAVDGVVRLWSLPATTLTGHGGLTIPAVSGDNRMMISGSYDGVVQMWDISDPTKPKELDRVVESAKVLSTTMSADGTRTVTALDNGDVVVRELEDSRLVTRAKLNAPTQFVAGVVISPDGRWLAATSTDHSVALWDLSDPARPAQKVSFEPSGNYWVTQLVISPDGHQLAVAQANGEVTLWKIDDLVSPTLVAGGTLSQTSVNSLAISNTGELATADDNNVRLWKVDGDDLKQTAIATGHARTVRSVYFDGDGKRMISGGDGQEVLLWDTSNPTELKQIGTNLTVPGPGHRIAGLTNNGNTIIVGGDNGFLQATTTDADSAARRICTYSRDYLTPERWSGLGLDSLPYSRLCTPEGEPS